MPEKDKTADYPVGPDGKKLKPCCVCPETKKVRDECIMDKVRGRRSGTIFIKIFSIEGRGKLRSSDRSSQSLYEILRI